MKPEHNPHHNFFSSSKVSGYGQSSFDPYDLSSDDEYYLTPKSMAEMTPRWGDHTAPLLTAARVYSNSPPKSLKNRGQVNPNCNDNYCDRTEIYSTFRLL